MHCDAGSIGPGSCRRCAHNRGKPEEYHDPVAQSRMVRLHGRPAYTLERLREEARWHRAVELAAQLNAETTLALNLDEPQ